MEANRLKRFLREYGYPGGGSQECSEALKFIDLLDELQENVEPYEDKLKRDEGIDPSKMGGFISQQLHVFVERLQDIEVMGVPVLMDILVEVVGYDMIKDYLGSPPPVDDDDIDIGDLDEHPF